MNVFGLVKRSLPLHVETEIPRKKLTRPRSLMENPDIRVLIVDFSKELKDKVIRISPTYRSRMIISEVDFYIQRNYQKRKF